MAKTEPGRYMLLAAVLSLAPAGALPWILGVPGIHWPWAVGGWAMLALSGVAGGGWLASSHGKPGNRFLAALVGGMLGRLFLTALGMGAAMTAGRAAMLAFAGGAVAGFLPAMAFELIWFYRAARSGAARA